MNPDNWPAAPVSYYLFENPWGLWGAALIAGVLLYLHGGRRGKIALKAIGGAIGGLASLVMLAALLVTTDREIMEEQTRTLVNSAVAPIKMENFRNLLSRDVTLFDRGYEQILASLERATGRWAVDQVWITNLLTHQQDADHGRTYMSLITRGSSGIGGGSMQSRWLLHWRYESDGIWRVHKIEWVSLGDSPATPQDLP